MSTQGGQIGSPATRRLSMVLTRRLLYVAAIAGVGLLRAAWTIAAQATVGIEALGSFNSDVSIVFLVFPLTALGWCALLLVRMPALSTREQVRLETRTGVGLLATSTLGACALVILGIRGVVFDPGGSALLFGAWSLSQFSRHSLLATRQYSRIVALDGVGGLAFLVVLAVCGPMVTCYELACVSISPYCALSLYRFARRREATAVRSMCPHSDECRIAFEFGTANWLSSAPSTLLVPFIAHGPGLFFSGALALIGVAFAPILLIARAISIDQVTRLAQTADPRLQAATAAERGRTIRKWLAVLSAFLAIGVFLWVDGLRFERGPLAMLAFSILAVALNAFPLVCISESALMMVWEASRALLRINAVAALLQGVLLGVAMTCPHPAASLWVGMGGSAIALLLRSAAVIRASRHGKPSTGQFWPSDSPSARAA